MIGGSRATKLLIETSIIPTVNRDGTLNLTLKPVLQTTRDDENGKPQTKMREINTTANLKDGDTLAIGGLRAVNDDGFFGLNSETEIVLLVSARVIPSEEIATKKVAKMRSATSSTR